VGRNELRRRIAQLIRIQGPISIAEFMTIALHDRSAGYYARRDPLGLDFTTAPEISQTFGELLGLWCTQVWRNQGCPSAARLVELGPGRGTLMCDALRAARLVPEFLAAIEVVLVESSPVLTAAQQDRLSNCGMPVRWVRDMFEIAHDRPSFIIANEFLDALPVQQFVLTDDGWRERVITAAAGDSLSFGLAPLPRTFRAPAQRGTAEAGAVYEVSPGATALVEDIARGIASAGGAALFIDYGYEDKGFGDTLQAVGKHSFAEVLQSPGELDLSCHVDFGAMARTAVGAGAQVYGPLAQREFLQALGIELRLSKLLQSGENEGERHAVQRLTDAGQMGNLFRVLAILPQGAPIPPGMTKGTSLAEGR
jgi:NADH dehydrogenase [ubiquinone] 1 alpha subcomplex assembly factor 7